MRVTLRKYKPHLIIGLLGLIIYLLVNVLIGENTLINVNFLNKSAKFQDQLVVFSSSRPLNLNNCFVDYNGYINITKKDDNKALNSDILMCFEDCTYNNNIYNFTELIRNDECAISNNILDDYKLKTGEYIYVFNTDIRFKIVKSLPSMIGMDKEANNSGTIILGFNSDLVQKHKPKTYLSFQKKDSEDIPGILPKTYSIRSRFIDKRNSLLIDYAVYLASSVLLITLCEIFIKRYTKFNSYYNVEYNFNMSKKKTIGIIIKDNILKYLLPFLIVSLPTSLHYLEYGILVFVPLITITFIYSIAIFINTVFIYKGVMKQYGR